MIPQQWRDVYERHRIRLLPTLYMSRAKCRKLNSPHGSNDSNTLGSAAYLASSVVAILFDAFVDSDETIQQALAVAKAGKRRIL